MIQLKEIDMVANVGTPMSLVKKKKCCKPGSRATKRKGKQWRTNQKGRDTLCPRYAMGINERKPKTKQIKQSLVLPRGEGMGKRELKAANTRLDCQVHEPRYFHLEKVKRDGGKGKMANDQTLA